MNGSRPSRLPRCLSVSACPDNHERDVSNLSGGEAQRRRATESTPNGEMADHGAISGLVRAVRYSTGTPARFNRDRSLVQLSERKRRRNSNGLLFVPQQARSKFPLIWTPNKEYTGDTVRIVVFCQESPLGRRSNDPPRRRPIE